MNEPNDSNKFYRLRADVRGRYVRACFPLSLFHELKPSPNAKLFLEIATTGENILTIRPREKGAD